MKKTKIKKQLLKDIAEFMAGIVVGLLIIVPNNPKMVRCEACGELYKYKIFAKCDKLCNKCFNHYQCVGESEDGYLYKFRDGTGYYFE